MNVFHVMIAQERRKADRPQAERIGDRLHSTGYALNAPVDPNIIYAAEWDQTSPWVTLRVGSAVETKDTRAGWPMVDKATWDAAQP